MGDKPTEPSELTKRIALALYRTHENWCHRHLPSEMQGWLAHRLADLGLADLEARLEVSEHAQATLADVSQCVIAGLEGELAAAKTAARDHHAHECMTCIATESERDAALGRLKKVTAYCRGSIDERAQRIYRLATEKGE